MIKLIEKASYKSKFFARMNVSYILIFAFAVISSFCLIMKADDYVWYYLNEVNTLLDWKNPNGRYLSNAITPFIVRNQFLRIIIYTCLFSFLLIVLSKLVDFNRKKVSVSTHFIFILFLLMPSAMYSMVTGWISAVPNYILSTLLSLFYVLLCFNQLFIEGYRERNFLWIITFFIGILGALCVENITIYNVVFGIFIIVFVYKTRKKFNLSNISFLIGAIIGTVLMFSSNQYDNIYSTGDSIGMRSFDFSFQDIFMKIYNEIIPGFSKSFTLINVIITISLLLLLYFADKSDWTKSTQKYCTICLVICSMYASYSVFTTCFTDFIPFDWSMKIRALETAFVFLYITSIIYLSFVLLSRSGFIRTTVYLLSAIMVTAPFCIVNPVTPRCFFSNYCFWMLAAGELFVSCCAHSDFLKSEIFKKSLAVVAVFIGCCLTYINLANKYCDVIRKDYITEQVENNVENIEIIELPYKEYTYDIFSNFLFDEVNIPYESLYLKYYGVNKDVNDFKFHTIDLMTYNTK